MNVKHVTIGILVLIFMSSTFAQTKRAMTVDDLWAMKRMTDLAVSPDGKWIAFSAREHDMKKNKSYSQIWLVPATGGKAEQLTAGPHFNGVPRWISDGSAISFISDRDGKRQIYKIPLLRGESRKLFDLPVNVKTFIWSPDGEKIAFTATVYKDARSLEQHVEMKKQKQDAMVKARIIDNLMFRSWDHWRDGKRSHIFVCDKDGNNVTDLTPGEFDAPPLALGGPQDFCFSPDGKQLAYVSNHDENLALSTNNDIFLVPVTGGPAKNVTADNKAVDNQPVFTPDGKSIIYRCMERPGFEADQINLKKYDLDSGELTLLTDNFDYDPQEIVITPNGNSVIFNASKEGRKRLFIINMVTLKISEIVENGYNSDLQLSSDGSTLFFLQQSVTSPPQIYSSTPDGKNVKQLTQLNKNLIDKLEFNPIEDFWFSSFDGKKAHGMIVKPPFFDESKKYPLLLLIHGGPQGMWSDSFHPRWNPSMFATTGYVVMMINIRGSKGYGQEWCDAVTKNWGEGPFLDIMAGMDYSYDFYPFIDRTRSVAAGGSYGGYMVNWIASHSDRFKALVSHAGVFDLQSMYGSTEELWFPEWEMGGPPWENKELYKEMSPSSHVQDFTKSKTPTLVIHGANDFRVPETQGFQMFTALQRTGVPSRLIYFPDENHFVQKPQNAKIWWNQIFTWFDKYINN